MNDDLQTFSTIYIAHYLICFLGFVSLVYTLVVTTRADYKTKKKNQQGIRYIQKSTIKQKGNIFSYKNFIR